MGQHSGNTGWRPRPLCRIQALIPPVSLHFALLGSWVPLFLSLFAHPLPTQRQQHPLGAVGVRLPTTLRLSSWVVSLFAFSDQQQSLRQSPRAPACRPGPGQSPRTGSPERAGCQTLTGAKHQEGLPLSAHRPHQLPGAGVTAGRCGPSSRSGAPARGKAQCLECLPLHSDGLASASAGCLCSVIWCRGEGGWGRGEI